MDAEYDVMEGEEEEKEIGRGREEPGEETK